MMFVYTVVFSFGKGSRLKLRKPVEILVHKLRILRRKTIADVKHDLASMDIKLLPHAQGKGIAAKALSFAIDKAFTEGKVNHVYVEPQSANKKAWALYEKLGFVSKERPTILKRTIPT